MISQLPPPVHGSSIVTRDLLGVLHRAGHRVAFVDRRFSRTVEEIGAVDARKAFAAVGLLLRLTRTLVRRRPQAAVFFATNRPASFLVDVALRTVLRAARTPTILYLHTNGFRALAARGPLWAVAVRLLLAGSAPVVCLGETLVADVLPWVDRGRVVLIPNATPPTPAAREAARPLRVLFLSNLIPEKGAHVAVEVGVRLAAGRDDLHVDIAGAGAAPEYRSRLEHRIAAAAVGDRVRLLGAVDPVRRDELLAEAAVLLFPSTYPFEAQPLTIVEAMAAGLPVVAYAVGGIRDLVRDGRSGVLVPVGDEEAAFDAVRALLDDPERRRAMGAEARRLHAAHHSPDAYAAAWRRVLGRVLDP